MLVTNTDPENRKLDPVFKGLKASQNVPDCSSCHNGPVIKFRQNLIIHSTVMLLTGTPPRLTYHENFMKIRSPVFPTSTDPEHIKIDPGFKELTARSRKCSRVFLVSCPTFPKNFMKIRLFYFSVMLLTFTDFFENI